MDDSAASEILTKAKLKKGMLPPVSNMHAVADHVLKWTKENNMEVNPSKTKERMIYFSKNPVFIPLITIDGDEIERFCQSKLLGNQVTDDLKWQKHIDTVYSKAARKLYTIIMLSKAALKQKNLVLVYITRLRPILDYCTQGLHKNSLNAWNQYKNEP